MMDFRNRNISPSASLIEALKLMNSVDKKLLLVSENGKFHGLISIGDIQRAIIKNINLSIEVKDVMRDNIKFALPQHNFESIRQMMIEYRMEFCPVVNNSGEILKIFYWEDIFDSAQEIIKRSFNKPVVIMAGGEGIRLRPLTNVLPKPLIPIGEKTMLEEIFEKFNKYGCDNFYVSVNYKSELIEYYLNNKQFPFKYELFKENKPLGTAGSLSLLKNRIYETFFVTNCDILIDQDYSEILDYHEEYKNEITIVAALKLIQIPYGTVKTGEAGELLELIEKPDLTLKINSGMYILEPDVLHEIPKNSFFHITELIDKIKKRNGRIGVFPINENSWKDIGNWQEYLKFI